MKNFRNALAGILLILLATLSLVWLTQRNNPMRSTLDGRNLALYSNPSVKNFLDGSWMKQSENFVDDRMLGRRVLLNLHAAIATQIFRQSEVAGVWIDRDSKMLFDKTPALPPIARLSASLSELQNTAARTHTPMLFVYVPKKEEVFSDALPAHWKNSYLDNKQATIDEFAKHGPVLDLTSIVGDKATRSRMWFKTDHHWNGNGAIMAADGVRAKLATMGLPVPKALPVLDEKTKYPDFIGSVGRKITYVGVPQADNFSTKWSSEIILRRCVNKPAETKVCTKPIFVKSRAKDKDVYANRYSVYMGGDNGMDDVRGNGTGTYIIFKDSFGDAFTPYFALGAKRVITIDERHYKGVPIAELIRLVKPDGIIFMHNQLTMSTFTDKEASVWR